MKEDYKDPEGFKARARAAYLIHETERIQNIVRSGQLLCAEGEIILLGKYLESYYV